MATLSVGGTTVFDGSALDNGAFPAGHILKVEQNEINTNPGLVSSSTPVPTGLITAITPTKATSKILVQMNGGAFDFGSATNGEVFMYCSINGGAYALVDKSSRSNVSSPTWSLPHSYSKLHAPSFTQGQVVRYQPYYAAQSGTFTFNNGYSIPVKLTLFEVAQ